MEVKFKLTHPDAKLPSYAKPGDNGLDLTAVSVSSEIIGEKKLITYDTHVAVEMPPGYVGLLFPRSSVYKSRMILSNCVGVLDNLYRGTIKAKFWSNDIHGGGFTLGDRILQLVILPLPTIEPVRVDELSPTERGESGFGSSGN